MGTARPQAVDAEASGTMSRKDRINDALKRAGLEKVLE